MAMKRLPGQIPVDENNTLDGRTLSITQKGSCTPFDPEIISHALNIDRRGSKRIVPMKVLALGLSRTGTGSLRQALFKLGYFDVYHGTSLVNENPRDCEL